MQQVSYLEGPTDADDAFAPVHVHQSQMMMMAIDDYDNVDAEEPLWCSG